VCDISHDITPLLASFPSSEGPDIRCAVSVGHSGVVIRDAAYSSRSASFVGDLTVLLLMPVSVTQQALVDSGAVARRMSAPFAPLASFVVLFGAMLPSVSEVVEASVEHGPRDIRGRRGIMEDAWLKAAEGIGSCKGSQRVLLFPAHVVVQFLEVGQVFGQVSDVIVGPAEALHFRAEGLISLLLDGKIDHRCESLPREEGVRLLACEDSSRVGVFSRSEGA
jgi:hypothetical protein